MARAYASAIIKAPIEVVWGIVRDFNGLPDWTDGIVKSKIEDKLDADVVGSIRAFEMTNGAKVRERLLIPSPSDQHSWAQSRRPIDIIRLG